MNSAAYHRARKLVTAHPGPALRSRIYGVLEALLLLGLLAVSGLLVALATSHGDWRLGQSPPPWGPPWLQARLPLTEQGDVTVRDTGLVPIVAGNRETGGAGPRLVADLVYTALRVVLDTFASHRTLTRLFLVEAVGAGREFHERMAAVHASFAELIARHLDEAVALGVIPPLDTAVAGRVWFGALNEVVTAWVVNEPATRLEDAYPTVRALLLRGVGAQVTEPEMALEGRIAHDGR
ncbi:MAG: hypothetical protein NVSMB65_21130 [Chloroflexota bacterium]